MVLVDVVPLLQADLLGARARLRGNELLEVADRVVHVALDAHLLAQTIVAHNLYHGPLTRRGRRTKPRPWAALSPRCALPGALPVFFLPISFLRQ